MTRAYWILPDGRRIRDDNAGRLYRSFTRSTCSLTATIVCDASPTDRYARLDEAMGRCQS